MNTFTKLSDLRSVFTSIITGWPVYAVFNGRGRKEITVNGVKRVCPTIVDITAVVEGRDVVMRANINEHSPDYGCGAWRYNEPEISQESFR
jgi:hypothetical protein